MTDKFDIRTELEPHLSRLRVAVYGSGGAPSHHLALLALWGGDSKVIYAGEIVAGGLPEYDAVIFPGGGLAAMAGQLEPLGAEGMTALRRWVEAGGSYLGSCTGSCHPLRMSDAYNDAYPDAAPFQVCDVTPLNAAAGTWGLDSPGTGRIRVMPEPHPLFEGLAEPFEIVHYNGPLFPEAAGAAGRVLGSTDHFTPFEVSQGMMSGPTVLGCALAQGARVAYHQRVGAGQVTLFGSHPEFGSSPLQLGWLPAVRLLSNALRLVPAGVVSAPTPTMDVLSDRLLTEMSGGVAALELGLGEAVSLKVQLPISAPAFLGLSGPELWDAALGEARGLLASLKRWLSVCPAGETVRGLHLLDCAPKPGQDVGFMGVRQLLGRSREMVLKATAPSAEWPAFTGAYDQLSTHPYHLLASSYLSACGLVAAAALQVGAFTALNKLSLPLPIPLTSGDLMMQRKRYSGYRSFDYLEPGTDYKAFKLAPELNRVPSTQVLTTPEQEARVKEVFAKTLVISLHDHCFVAPENLSEFLEFRRWGRDATAYEGLSVSGLDAVFDNLMNGTAMITSRGGWKWDDIIYDLGIRLSDIAHQEMVVLALSTEDIVRAKENGQVAFIVSLEGAAMIENELDRIDILYGLGVRCLGIAYSEANALGSGLKEPHDGGLTSFGRRAVKRMNKLGMAIDISHSGDRTSMDTVEVSDKPIFITHAGARTLWNSNRLKPDEVIRACAEKGGVIGIEAAPHTTITEKNPRHSIESFMEHFEYCAELVGIDHVTFGPDALFGDHVGLHHALSDALSIGASRGALEYPEVEWVDGLENPAEAFPNIVRWLVTHGYSDEDIAKAVGGNVMRVLKEVWYR